MMQNAETSKSQNVKTDWMRDNFEFIFFVVIIALCALALLAGGGCNASTEHMVTESKPVEKPQASPSVRQNDKTGDTYSFDQHNGVSEELVGKLVDAILGKRGGHPASSQPSAAAQQIAEILAEASGDNTGPGGSHSSGKAKSTYAAVQNVILTAGGTSSTPTSTQGGNATGTQSAPQSSSNATKQDATANVPTSVAFGMPGSAPNASASGTLGSGTTSPTNSQTGTPTTTTLSVPNQFVPQALQFLQGLGLSILPGSSVPAQAALPQRPSVSPAPQPSPVPAPPVNAPPVSTQPVGS